MSQDPITLESVCYDILKAEFTSDKHTETFPQVEGVDDHLHQAADSLNWPAGIRYDPENDGTVRGSLGVHEHWDNATDQKYSRNLGIGEGIELVKIQNLTSVDQSASGIQPNAFILDQNYPNPFNPTTVIRYQISSVGTRFIVCLKVYDVRGKKVATLFEGIRQPGSYEATFNGSKLASGEYFYRLQTTGFILSKKMLMIK